MWHHASDLTSTHRDGLFVALESAWPRTQGDRKDVDHRRFVAQGAAAQGATTEAIADAFAVQPDTVRRWVKSPAIHICTPDGGMLKGKIDEHAMRWSGTVLFGAAAWAVEVLPGTGADQPPDPAAPGAIASFLAPDSAEQQRRLDDTARAGRALRGTAGRAAAE